MMRAVLVCALLCCCWLVAVHSDCMDSEGRSVPEGAGPFIGPDHCNSCMCRQGFNICTKMFCTPGHHRCMGPNRRIYKEGQSFKAADGCNTCACMENGSVACTEMACLKTTPPSTTPK